MSGKRLLISIAHFIIIKTKGKGKMLCSSPLAVASDTGEVKRLSLFSCYRHAFTLVLCQLQSATLCQLQCDYQVVGVIQVGI